MRPTEWGTDPDDLLISTQVGRLVGATREQIRRWAECGYLPHTFTPGGQLRVRREDAQRFKPQVPDILELERERKRERMRVVGARYHAEQRRRKEAWLESWRIRRDLDSVI